MKFGQTEMLLLLKGGFTGQKGKKFLFIMSGFSVFVGLVSGSRREQEDEKWK